MVSQFQDSLGGLDLRLSGEQFTRLDAVSRTELGFPLDFFEHARQFIFGETFPLIDNRPRR